MSIEQAREVLKIEAEGIEAVLQQIGAEFDQAIAAIMSCHGRVIITGIGKSGIIGQKIAATLNSTGTSAFFLHPVEAMHGDLGIVDAHDIVLAISYSGETAEVNLLLPILQKRGVVIIAMTGDPTSTLADHAEIVLNIKVPREACPLGLAPTASTTASLAMGDALAVVLIGQKKFLESDFRRNHPGGSLGERLKVMVSEVMLTGDRIPRVAPETLLIDALHALNEKNLGAVLIINEQQQVVGILTDGDIRRLISKAVDFTTVSVQEVMTPSPKTIRGDLLAADALSIMQRHEVTILAVQDADNLVIGILHLHDLLGQGEFRFLV